MVGTRLSKQPPISASHFHRRTRYVIHARTSPHDECARSSLLFLPRSVRARRCREYYRTRKHLRIQRERAAYGLNKRKITSVYVYPDA